MIFWARSSRGGAILSCILGAVMSFGQAAGQEAPKQKADVIFMHANVYTGVPAEGAFQSVVREEAIAVRGDRILAVGKFADLQKLKGDQTQVIDLDGHFVMPGLTMLTCIWMTRA